jgi:hypothetical protein
VCYNCDRRQITCDFSLTPPGTTTSPRRSESTDGKPITGDSLHQPTVKSPGSLATPQQTSINPFDAPDLVPVRQTTELDITDLRLLHHFTTVVALDLAHPLKPDTLRLWQQHLVELGFRHEFLLRGILAVAAYHIAYTSPTSHEEFTLLASNHQSLALAQFQDALTAVSATNCHALFAFSCLIIILTFASSPKSQPAAADFNTDVLQWFHMLRGGKIVLDMFPDAIKQSFLKPLLDEMAYTENTATHSIPGADRITDLFRVCNISSHERETSQAYTLAIHTLLSTFTQASICRNRGDGTILASLVWPVSLPPRFVDLLSEKQPEALVILAHYCVLISWAQDSDWFISGWGRYMLETIRESVPESWHEHLKWPDEMIAT